jgi:hypothetical protein
METHMKPKFSAGKLVLAIGMILLLFTFVVAFLFLLNNIHSILPQSVVQTFGGTFAPLVILVSNAVYLGIMVWIGSELAFRGSDLLKKEKYELSKIT